MKYEITQKYTIPTGYLFVGEYEKGPLETLSIGDYGKRYNVKANFLGYHDEIKGVPNVHCMPLSEKWVVTISTQHGCVMKCTFCDVPNVKWRGNATFGELKAQLYNAIGLFPECNYTERLNIHFARMGEPIFNEAVFEFSRWLIANKRQIASDTGLRIEVLHPVLTTSSPRKFAKLEERILEWCEIKNDLYNGQAGLQFSINSTSDEQRSAMYTDMQIYLDDLAKIAEKMPEPISRKYCLNFAFATGNECDGNKMAAWFDPAKFMCKITPIHNNNACREHGIETPKIARKKLRQEPEDNFSAELLSHVRGHFLEGPIFMALFLAFRRGETCGLQWPDIDSKHLEVTIRNQRHPLLGLSTPKSQSERVIPITPEILAMIERLGDRNSLFVFTDGKGRPLLENQVSKLVPKLIEEAGLRRCVYHDLRSYAASNLLELGADIQMVAEILGHTDLRTTALYLNATRRKKRSAIGGYFSSAIGGHAVAESASPLSGLTTDSSHSGSKFGGGGEN